MVAAPLCTSGTKNLDVNPSCPGLFLVDTLLIAPSVSDLVTGLFRDLTSSWFSLGRMYLSRNLSIFLDFLVCVEVFTVLSDGRFFSLYSLLGWLAVFLFY